MGILKVSSRYKEYLLRTDIKRKVRNGTFLKKNVFLVSSSIDPLSDTTRHAAAAAGVAPAQVARNTTGNATGNAAVKVPHATASP